MTNAMIINILVTGLIRPNMLMYHNLDRLAVGAKLIRERQERFIDRCTIYYVAL